MKVNVNSNTLKNALEKIQVKGKYVNKGGLSAGKLDEVFYMTAKDDTLSLWTGNNTFIVNLQIEAEVLEQGAYIGKSSPIIAYLKKFDGDVMLEKGDFLTLSAGSKRASLPRVVEWPPLNAITRMGPMMMDVPLEIKPDALPSVGRAAFEGCFVLNSQVFSDVISGCELVGSGVYKINFDEELTFSSSDGVTNNYSEVVEPLFRTGDPATVEYSGPLHSFFEKDQMLTFYVLDDAPLLIVADDRRLVKAPYVAGV